MKIVCNNDIDRLAWLSLVVKNDTGTWFQTPEAYEFFAQVGHNSSFVSLPELFRPFAFGIENGGRLRGICSGYITVEKSALKQFMTRRAIIVGGPVLANDATNEEVQTLMEAVREELKRDAIYVETRNFNDYSKWRTAFEASGFVYQPHLNFHVHTNQSWGDIEANIGKHRRKYIRLSFRDGATIEENPTIEQVRAYYDILADLYKTKVKMPLLPWSFFELLYHLDSCKYLLVMYNGQVIGGSICMLLPGKGVYEWYACGKDGEFKNIHPSSVTKYAGMKYATDHGYVVFDMMGAGKPDEEYGVRDFKAEFGGELVEYGRFLCVTKSLLYKIGVLGVKMLKKLK